MGSISAAQGFGDEGEKCSMKSRAGMSVQIWSIIHKADNEGGTINFSIPTNLIRLRGSVGRLAGLARMMTATQQTLLLSQSQYFEGLLAPKDACLL